MPMIFIDREGDPNVDLASMAVFSHSLFEKGPVADIVDEWRHLRHPALRVAGDEKAHPQCINGCKFKTTETLDLLLLANVVKLLLRLLDHLLCDLVQVGDVILCQLWTVVVEQ